MESQVKAITLRAVYESNLTAFKDDIATIKSFKRNLEKNGIKVPIRLNMSAIKADAVKAAQLYKKTVSAAMASASPGGAMSKGGIAIPASAVSQMKAFASTSSGAFKQVAKESGEVVQTFEQLERGMIRVTSFGKKGKKTARLFDSRPLETFRQSLDDIERKFSGLIGKTKANKGDVAGLLTKKRDEIAAVLSGKNLGKTLKGDQLKQAKQELAAVRDTPLFQKAERSLDRLEERIATSQGSQDRANAVKSRGLRIDSLKEGLAGIDDATASKIGSAAGNKGDVASVLADKRQRMVNELAKFSDVADSPAYKSAKKAITTLDKQIAQAVPSQKRATDKAKQNARIGQFKDNLLGIENQHASRLGQAQGSKGDVSGVLRSQRQRIAQELSQFQDIKDSPAFKAAGKSIINLDKQIARAVPTEKRAADASARKSEITKLKDGLLSIDKATSKGIGSAQGNKGDVAAALTDKRNRIAGELAKFSGIADSSEFKQAQKAINTLDKQIAQTEPAQKRRKESDQRKDFNRRTDGFIDTQNRKLQTQVKQTKVRESNAQNIDKIAKREREINRAIGERIRLLEAQAAQYRKLEGRARKRGMNEAADRYKHAANTTQNSANQEALDLTRRRNRNRRDVSDDKLKTQLSNIKRRHDLQRETLKNQESIARKIANRTQKEAALNKVLRDRQALQKRTGKRITAIGRAADKRGLRSTRDKATSMLGGLERQGIADMRKLGIATTNSGHALNFHTSSLLKNAATFTKWYVPAQLAMGAFRAIGQGAKGAVDAQRTFKILNAVFRGTAEEAKTLADQTLYLASANGRSTEEAAEAAVAWARLGLTRTQVLIAMESSLRAANVAEISAAEATAYLTANYKAFGQTIAEIPATLDYINSLSNKNPVAPKEIFEGLSRSAATAKVAGLAFEDLAAIITTVSATTQRPGQEVGNSLNTVLTRLRRPTTTGKLKKEFGIDVTTAEGDAKKMKDILSELAALYPTLNRLEKARLGDVAAGARQGNRFSIIMESWTDSLIAQGRALLDTNSAMRENESIMDSVSSKLASLDTAWTRLFHTVGETGVFDAMTASLEGMAGTLDAVSNATNYAVKKLSELTGLSQEDVGNYLSKGIKEAGKTVLGPTGLAPILFRDPLSTDQNNDDKKRSADIGLLGGFAKQAIESKRKVEALAAAEEAFIILSKQFGAKGVDPEKILTQFDEAVHLLAALPGGESNVAKARLNIRPLLEKGKTEQGREALSDTASNLRTGKDKEYESSEKKRKESLKTAKQIVEQTRKHINALNQDLAGEEGEDQQKRLTTEIHKTSDALKQQQDALATLRKEYEKGIPDPLAGHVQRIDAYVSDLKAIGKVYGSLMQSFGSTGFANLDASLKLGAARLDGNLLAQTIDATRLQNDRDDAFGNSTPEQKATRDAVLTRMELELNKIREASAEAEREIELQRQTGTLQTHYDDSRTSTASGLNRYEIGQSQSERVVQRTRGAMNELARDIANPNLGAGGPAQDAKELGALTERMVQSKQGLASIEDQMNRALADRVNLEGDITEEARKQNQEAARSLALASREDQLRVAAAAAVLRSRNASKYSMEEFQFFTMETRQAIANYSPGRVNGLDSGKSSSADYDEQRGKLDNEISGLVISLRAMKQQLANLIPKAEAKGAGITDLTNPLADDIRTGNRVIDNDKEEVRMNLKTGPISIDLDFSSHIQSIKEAIQIPFDAKLDNVMAEVRRILTEVRGPDTAPLAGAW